MADDAGDELMLVVGYDAQGDRELAPNGEHVLLIGPPGSGKTHGFLIPSVITHPGAVVATSSKSDIVSPTVARRGRVGRTLSFSPGSAPPVGTAPVAWDPVRGCGDLSEAILRSDAMVRTIQALNGGGGEDAFWYAMSARTLGTLFHAAALLREAGGGEGVLDVLSWVTRGELDVPRAILGTADRPGPAAIVDGIRTADARLRDSVLMTAVQALRVFDVPSVQASMDRHGSFDADRFVRSQDTLYIVAPLEQQELLAPLIVGLIDEVSRAAMTMAMDEEHLPRDQRRSVVFALDEVANIAPLPNLPRLVSAGGGQGCQVMAVLQDLSQAKGRWRDQSEGFVTMFHHKILLLVLTA